MLRVLSRVKAEVYYYTNGNKIVGTHTDIYGNVSGIYGNVSGIYGDVSGIYGDVSGIRGNVSGIYGNVSGIYGNVDEAKISDEEREEGIDIADLIKE